MNWFISYLSNRKQYVYLNSAISPSLHINCEVSHGSILGPLLFIIYINDIVNAFHVANFIMFADDMNLFLKHLNLTFLFYIINTELSKISQWFKLNKLSLNIKKMNYNFQAGNRTVTKDTHLNLIIDNVKIEQAEHTKFLGVIINSKLTWQNHIKLVSSKVSKRIGILSKIRYNLSSEILLMLYHTLVQPYFDYCNIIFGLLRIIRT